MEQDGPEAAPGSADSPEGVFGNLPSTRPGSRSPRRRSTEEETEAPEAEPEQAISEETSHEPHVGSEPSVPKVEEDSDTGEGSGPTLDEPPLASQPGIQGVEDLAWAGVAAMAQAATAGIRFTSKALEAARKSIDRP